MPSLALIFHLIEAADKMGSQITPVSVTAAKQAAAWCDYLESHARRIYGMAANVNHQAAAKLAKKIQAGALPNLFSLRDIYRKGWGLLDDKAVAQIACDELLDAGWLREISIASEYPGRPKVRSYRINPKLKIKSSVNEMSGV